MVGNSGPPRVFAASDYRTLRLPLWKVDSTNEGPWTGPARWPWATRWSDDDPVLTKALLSWGALEPDNPRAANLWLDWLLTEEGTPVDLGEPVLWEDEHGAFLVEGVRGYIPATPVYYAERRFGDTGQWYVLDRRPAVVRYEVQGQPVMLVVAVVPGGVP